MEIEKLEKEKQRVDEDWFLKYNILKEENQKLEVANQAWEKMYNELVERKNKLFNDNAELERIAKTQETLRKNAYEIRDGFIKANQHLTEKLEEWKKKADYYEAHYNVNYEVWQKALKFEEEFLQLNQKIIKANEVIDKTFDEYENELYPWLKELREVLK